jgi:GT2 family glycosyltransferase
MGLPAVSVAIPTYRREQVLLDTVAQLLALEHRAAEILVVDQSEQHQAETERRLDELHRRGDVRWVRLPRPSIPVAMNWALQRARSDLVLFLDDDVQIISPVVQAHAAAHAAADVVAVVGRILQPGEAPLLEGEVPYHGGRSDDPDAFRFNAVEPREIQRIMAGNLSLKRAEAVRIGGFDENFVRVAYRFEAEFAERILLAGGRIRFEPAAAIRHLQAARGGTRAYGDHLHTIRPDHRVGQYYYFLRSTTVKSKLVRIMANPFKAVMSRHHLRKPWWIPVTLIAELWGLAWAILLYLRGPAWIGTRS